MNAIRFSIATLLIALSAVVGAKEAPASKQIFAAVKKGDKAAVEALISGEPKLVHAKDKNAETALHLAARLGSLDIVKLLVANKSDINAHNNRTYRDRTPLTYAVQGGHKEVVEFLLASKADINCFDRTWKLTALHEAVLKKNLEIAKLLLAHKANPNTRRRYEDNCAPIQQAKSSAMIKLLVEHGADINIRDGSRGRTLLHRSATPHGSAAFMKLALELKADPNIGDHSNRTPLFECMRWGYADRVGILLAGGANPNARDAGGATPLHAAAQHGQLAIIKTLLKHKADINAATRRGITVLQCAVDNPNPKQSRLAVVSFLLENNARVDTRDTSKRSPLFNAARAGEKAVVELLLKKGADPSATDTRGQQPLHEAARAGKTDAVHALLAHEAAINAKDEQGRTPLYLAALGGHKSSVVTLIEAGAEPNLGNRFNETPLFWASSRGHKEIAALLREKGGKMTVSPSSPTTPPAGKTGDQRGKLADLIVSKLKLDSGVALDVGCGDAGLAIEVAKRSELWFKCADSNEASIQRAQAAMEAAGLYGTRMTAEVAASSMPPCPPLCANLIIAGDEFAAGKRGRDLSKIYQLLSPNGVAVIGQGPGAKGEKLDRGTLEGWLKEAGIKTFDIINEQGVWAVVTRPRPEGSDEWRYRSHDPGNTHGSNDRLIGGTLRSHWVSRWRPGISAASVVIGDGRMICASLEYPGKSGVTPFLQAVDAYTGTELWARSGKDELPYNRTFSKRSALVDYGQITLDIALVGDSVFLLGGKACYEFDARDGTSRNNFPVPEGLKPGPKDVWLYLSVVGDLIYGGMGPATGIGATWSLKFPRGNCRVFALNRKTGKLAWSVETLAMTGSIALGDGKLFFCDQKYGIRALDAVSGKEVFANAETGFTTKNDIVRGSYYDGKYWLLYHPTSGRYISQPNRKARTRLFGDSVRNARKLAAFSGEDGKRLFDCDLGKQIAGVSFAGDNIIGASQHLSRGRACAIDVKTGKSKWQVASYFKCAPVVATPHAVLARSTVSVAMDLRPWEKTRDPKSLRWRSMYGFRPNCTYPAIPANGLVYVHGPGCNCAYPVRANAALFPGKLPTPNDADRLVKGPAYDNEPANNGDKSPWRTWRGDARRSAISKETPANVGDWALSWEQKQAQGSTPLAAAEGLVFNASTDNRVRAFDGKTGKPTWRYFAKGRIAVSPFYWKGRLYFSDDDGWVHCLRAKTGECVWRFRAAPAIDRVIGYGKLRSRWPVGSGVLVSDGVVYCASGFFPSEGVTTYALDATTGALRWKKKNTQPHYKQFVPMGPMALGKGCLWAPSGWGLPWKIGLNDKDKPDGPIKGARYTRRLASFGDGSEALMASHRLDYVHWRHNFKRISAGPRALPVVTSDMVYLRNGTLSAEKRNAFRVSKGVFTSKSNAWDPSTVKWKAWTGVPMTAIAMSGDVLFTGGRKKVFATHAADGKELWSAPVPATVIDLAINSGALYVLCEDGSLLAFSKKQ